MTHLKLIKNELLQKRFLTLKEVSQIYNIPLNTLRVWAAQGRFPHYKRSANRIVVKTTEFEEWHEKFRVERLKI